MRGLSVAVVIAAWATAASDATAAPRATDADAVARLTAARAEIRSHVHALRYAEARAAAEAALAIGAADPATLAELVRTLGEVTAALGDDAAAERWFVAWLTIDPQATLPPGTSPKLTDRLAAARGRGAGLAPARREIVEGDAPRLEVMLAGDPGGLVAAAAVRVGGERELSAPVTAAAIDVPLPADTTRVEVSLRDRAGNEVAAFVVERAVSSVAPVSGRRRSLLRRPWPYAIGAGVLAATGGVLVWRRQVARDDLDAILADSGNHTFGDAEAARDRAETYGWLSVAGFAAAGALAVTAIVLSTLDDAEVVLAPSPGGVSVGAALRF